MAPIIPQGRCYNGTMDISIIIPVYNAEKYLRRCLGAVIASLDSFKGKGEILLIDNNSTDSSLAILKDYQKRYPKFIRVLQCHTVGAAAARNLGASKASGKYLWFIDADDVISENAVRKLMHEANAKDADLVMMGAKRFYENGVSDQLSAVMPSEDNYKSRFVRYGLGPWQVLIRRAWWNSYGFKFKEGIIHEDMELMSALILHTDKYTAINEPLYHYYRNSESVLHKASWEDAHAFDIFPALEGLYARFEEAGAIEEYHDELEWFFIWNLLIDAAKDFARFPEGKPGFKRSREMLKKYFPKWRKNRFLRQKPIKLQLKVRVNYIK